MQISFYEAQVYFPEESARLEGPVISWTSMNFESFLVKCNYLQETMFLHTSYKANKSIDDPFLEHAMNIREKQLMF